MKTTNFCMDLMVPSQLNKDIVFNEALLKIDSFMNFYNGTQKLYY